MNEGLVITDRELRVVSSNQEASLLSLEGDIEKDDALSKHFPGLAERAAKKTAGFVLKRVPVRKGRADVHVMEAGDLLCFRFVPHEEGKSVEEESPELEFLREQNKHLMSIIEEAPIGIMLINEAGNIVYINRKQEENSRKKREDLLNRQVREMYPKAYDDPRVEEMYQALFKGNDKRFSVIVDPYYPQFYRKDMIVKFYGYKIEELGWIALFIEIEDELYREKRKAEKAGQKLRQSKIFLAQVLDASPNMVITTDNRRRIVSFNKTAEHILGFSPQQVFNTPVDRFFPPEELPKLYQAMEANTLWFDTMTIYRFDKTAFQVEVYATKIKDTESGKNIATLLLGVDIDEREKLRKNLIQSQKMNFIGELMSALAHQLNNPLVGVMNISDVLLRKMDQTDRNYPLLKMIRDAGVSCHETIARLLSFSRKPEKNAWVTVNIQDVLNASIDFVSRHALFQKVEVERNFHPVPFIRGDPVLLQQAFMNVLYNGAQAIDGTGKLTVSCTGIYGMGNQVEISIRDTGRGIPKDDLPRIFEPFFTTKSEDSGTGIGLSLVYWIIQDHKGRIEVESEVGKGTAFTVTLPAITS